MNNKIIYSKRSALNLIEVVESTLPGFEGRPELCLNNESLTYSIYPDENFSFPHYFNLACLAPLMSDIQKVLILGFGPGMIYTKLSYLYQKLVFDAVEIDPEIVEVGYKYFGLKKGSGINIFIADAQKFLESVNNIYDLIIMDVFEEGQIPYHLRTAEFFQLVFNHLSKAGIFFLNLYLESIYKQDIRLIAKTVGKIFPSVFFIHHIPVLFACKRRTYLWRLKTRLRKTNHHLGIAVLKEWVILQIKKFRWRMTNKIITD